MIKLPASHLLLVALLCFPAVNTATAEPPPANTAEPLADEQSGVPEAGDVREDIEWYEIEAAIQRAEQARLRQRIERSEEELEWWRIEQERLRQELRRLRDAMATQGDLPAAGTTGAE